MPVPAPTTETSSSGEGNKLNRHYTDLFGRAYTGRVTIRRSAPLPIMSLSVPLESDGSFEIYLPNGTYSLGAMLRDVEGGRAYIADEITIGE